jgi:hypothetical protein
VFVAVCDTVPVWDPEVEGVIVSVLEAVTVGVLVVVTVCVPVREGLIV